MASFMQRALTRKNKDNKRSEWPMDKKEYQLMGSIGHGGCAEVVLAKCSKNQRLCAIKQIDLTGSSAIDQSLREIRLMSKLKHPNLISLKVAFVNEHMIWIVEEFFPLGSLKEVMNRGDRQSIEFRAFDEKSISSILRDVLGALEYLHKSGFVHNDIKPGNIFLKHDGNAVLADLGGAKSVTDKTPGMTVTEAFKAPEVHRRTLSFNFKSDIWSVGITALVLYGEVVVMTMKASERIRAVMDMKFQGLSQPFRQFLSAALEINPNRRASIPILLQMDFFQYEIDKQTIADEASGHLKSKIGRSNSLQDEIMERIMCKMLLKDLNDPSNQ